MTLQKRRQCKTCEYYVVDNIAYRDPTCNYYPPKIYGDSGYGKFPSTTENKFCSKWEPNWHENPQLKAAWEEFMLVHKLITCGEEKND